MSFRSSLPLLKVISLVQFACINRRPRRGGRHLAMAVLLFIHPSALFPETFQ